MVNVKPPKRIEIARALGLSAAAISKHSKSGMPTSSIEAALAWHSSNIDAVRSAGQRLHTVARMTAARPAATSPGTRQAKPAAGPPGGVVGEFLQAVAATRHDESQRRELPEVVGAYLRALLRCMEPSEFRWMYWSGEYRLHGMRGVDWLLPRAVLEWSLADPDEDSEQDITEDDLSAVYQVATRQATFVWDPTAPWPAFRHCCLPIPGAALDLAAARRDFEASQAAQA